ncbi:MAG: 50S ribosomal protein L9 [Alphaproteobacteria bacterium]|jgi:large subunit ribosomal protein L9|nr:50S ribosomal protein L9 [Alphaproteobacteria bacterium]
MQVILLEKIEKLGTIGDLVDVKSGFARNFLLPEGKALRATKENKEVFEARKAELEKRNEEAKKTASEAAKKIAGKTFVAVRQAGDTGHLYGSVTSKDVAKLLVAAGFEVASQQVKIGEPIKQVGIYSVTIAFHPEVLETVKINVAKSEEEAKVAEEMAAKKSVKKAEKPAEETTEAPAEEAAE